jgi:two-component system chemotaxis response regulator CheY
MRAFVIDDSRAMRMILRRILTDLGFECAEAGDGREALERLNALGRADLALVDWNMPVMNGLDFITAVRADPRHRAMRIMMVTTEVEMTQVARAIAAGANEYVMKPFTPEVIIEKLDSLGFQRAAA